MSEELIKMLDDTKDRLQEGLRLLNQEMVKEFLALKQWEPPAPPPTAPAPTGAGADDLLAATQSFSSGTTQIEILKSLVEHVAKMVPRVLLLIRKGGNLHGWSGDGFTPEFTGGPMKKVVWPLDRYPELIKVAQNKQPMILNFTDLSDINTEIEGFDGFSPFKSCFYPLVVKGKVAAVLYVDSGSEAGLDRSEAAQLLCHVAGLELTSLAFMGKKAREANATAPVSPKPRGKAHVLPPVEPEPVSDFHPNNVIKSKSGPRLEEEEQQQQVSGATLDDFRPQTIPELEPAPMPAAPSFATQEEEDPGIKKAKRVARVLVSDLKLYNEAQVSAGQSNGDLYTRLREDIDRSFVHYKERTSGLVPDGTNFFKLELIRQLGEGIGPLPF